MNTYKPKRSIEQIARAVASMIPGDGPARLAREAITYVGGTVPGAPQAVGVWEGGTERASIVRLPADKAANLAVALAERNRQKTAIWFTPGQGNDLLHVLTVPGPAADAKKRLNHHGVTYATLQAARGGTTVHVIDQGGELRGPMQAFAAEHNVQYAPTPGVAGYSRTKLHRVDDPHAHDNLLVAARDSEDPRMLGVFGDWLQDNGAPGGLLAVEGARAHAAGEYHPIGGHWLGRAGTFARYQDFSDPQPMSFIGESGNDPRDDRRGGRADAPVRAVPYGEVHVIARRYHANVENGHPDGHIGYLVVTHAPKKPVPGSHLQYEISVRDKDHFVELTRDLPARMRVAIWRHLRPRR